MSSTFSTCLCRGPLTHCCLQTAANPIRRVESTNMSRVLLIISDFRLSLDTSCIYAQTWQEIPAVTECTVSPCTHTYSCFHTCIQLGHISCPHSFKAVAPIISVCLLLLMQLCAHQSVRSILFVVNSFLRLTTMPFTASRSKNLCAHLQTGCASTTHQTSTRGTCAMSEQQLA